MPVLGDVSETEGQNSRRILGVKADGSLWIYCLVQYAATLLNQSKHARIIHAFSVQREAWDRYLISYNESFSCYIYRKRVFFLCVLSQYQNLYCMIIVANNIFRTETMMM